MRRHSVIWRLRDTTTPALQAEMLQGLAYLRMEYPMVRWGDYGEDLFGGMGQNLKHRSRTSTGSVKTAPHHG
jgi:hypothetical protein